MKTVKVIIPVLVLAVALGAGQIGNVKAWDEGFGPEGGFFHHWGYFHHWGECCGPIIDQGPSIGGCCDQNQRLSGWGL